MYKRALILLVSSSIMVTAVGFIDTSQERDAGKGSLTVISATQKVNMEKSKTIINTLDELVKAAQIVKKGKKEEVKVDKPLEEVPVIVAETPVQKEKSITSSKEKSSTSKKNNSTKDNNTSSIPKTENKASETPKIEEKKPVEEEVPKKEEPKQEVPKEPSSPIKTLPNNYSYTYNQGIENEILKLVNNLRAENGLGALKSNDSLKESARYKSNSMLQLGYFSHNNPNYDNKNSGYLLLNVFKINSSKVGENIAMYSDRREERKVAESLFNLWLNSSSHKAAMLSTSYTKIGIGVVISTDSDGRYKMYGTQHFAK